MVLAGARMSSDGWVAVGAGIGIFLIGFIPWAIWRCSDDYRRSRARRMLEYISDGRPAGCKCPPNPGTNALPCDNKHIGSKRCPLTVPHITTDNAEELAAINARLDQLDLALQLLAPETETETKASPPGTSWVKTGGGDGTVPEQ